MNLLRSPEIVKKTSLKSEVLDLKAQMMWWLKLATDNDFLNLLRNQPEVLPQELFTQFLEEQKSEIIAFDFLELESIWMESLRAHTADTKTRLGWQGFKVGDRVVQSRLKNRKFSGIKSAQNPYDYKFGAVVDLEIVPVNSTPIVIVWEGETEQQKYSLYDLKTQHISPILPIKQLSDSIAYEVSADGLFYRAFLGFSSQAIAKSWQRKLKGELGWVESPKQLPESEKPTPHKYHCIVENPKQKTLAARRNKLEIVASWDLKRKFRRNS
jgi:hypothetical protein